MASSTAMSPGTPSRLPLTPYTNKSLRPSTPASSTITKNNAPSTPVTPSPGTWRHPRWDEISNRQKAQIFDKTNITTAGVNLSLLIATLWWDKLPIPLPPSISTYILFPLRLLLTFNFLSTFIPLYRRLYAPDSLPDVDLLPAQRALVGLDPRATPPATANTVYVTPPKYPRSASAGSTPGSASGGDRGTPSRSPQVRDGANAKWKNSPLGKNSPAGSTGKAATSSWMREPSEGSFRFVPSRQQGSANTSPGREFSGGMSLSREFSGSTSTFMPSTPSPTGAKGGASVGLNARWLYERGRRGSGTFS